VSIAAGEVATEDTFVTFDGETTFSGDHARLPFQVRSANWQESDRLLVALMTAFGAPTRPVEMDGVWRVRRRHVGRLPTPAD
jgi:hypothetical protein